MSVNKVILIGNVGKDPEVRYLDTGIAVASFPLATTDRAYTLSNGTQVPERTEWHNLVLWRGLAETAEKYVHKGDKLYVEGKIRTRSYDDQTGAKRYVTEIFEITWKCCLQEAQRPELHRRQVYPDKRLLLYSQHTRRLLLHKIIQRTIYRSNCLTKTKIFGPRRLFMPVGRCF